MRKSSKDNLSRLEWVKKCPCPPLYKKDSQCQCQKFHFGQVVPLEDAEKIINGSDITSALCAAPAAGKSNARLPAPWNKPWTTMLIGGTKGKSGSADPSEAKMVEDFDKRPGSFYLVHEPFIGAVCNYDRVLPYREAGSDLLELMFRAIIEQDRYGTLHWMRNCMAFVNSVR